ncbi:hypothetical protein FJ251_07835 [bacterium]|nr:hypothetical protein [bacterium]
MGNRRVQKFDANGNFVATWGGQGEAAGEFSGPEGIVVTWDNRVYVADALNSRIQKFRQKFRPAARAPVPATDADSR